MKTPLLAILALCALSFVSCETIQEYVSVVNDRRPDGTYLPLGEVVSPKTGKPAIAKGSFYVFPDGEIGVTTAYGPLGQVAAPQFSIKK